MRRILTILVFILAATSAFGAPASKLDQALEKKVKDSSSNSGLNNGTVKVRVIIRTTGGDPDRTGVTDQVVKNNGKVSRKFSSFPGLAAELPITAVQNVASNS